MCARLIGFQEDALRKSDSHVATVEEQKATLVKQLKAQHNNFVKHFGRLQEEVRPHIFF